MTILAIRFGRLLRCFDGTVPYPLSSSDASEIAFMSSPNLWYVRIAKLYQPSSLLASHSNTDSANHMGTEEQRLDSLIDIEDTIKAKA